MARNPNVLCAGNCGTLLWGGRGCLPAGTRTCRSCRALGLAPIPWSKPKPRPVRTCSLPGCERTHLAKGLCRKHYKREQPSSSALPTITLNCLANLNGRTAPKVKTVEIRILANGGTLVRCPWCSSTMAFTSDAFRTCPMCVTTVALNPEELSWVIYETLSIRRLPLAS